MQIHSFFQPIISLMHRRTVGYEALLRAQTPEGKAVSPLAAFQWAAEHTQVEQFDRRCLRQHLQSFSALNKDSHWLFLNLRGESIHAGNFREQLLSRFLLRQGVGKERIVLEILEDSVKDPGLLQDFVRYYQQAGFLVAIDDFGTGQSNFDRIWQLEPQIVKLDRSMLLNARSNSRRQRWLSRCVALLRETGALVLIEGVETKEDAQIALEADADLLQGFYFARPSPTGECDESALADTVHHLHQTALSQQLVRQHQQIRKHQLLQKHLHQAANRLVTGDTFADATQPLAALEAVMRVYLLDAQGVQIVENLNLQPTKENPRYHPLGRSVGAIWARRSYFRQAVEEPGRTQFSSPYLGLPDASLSVTLSIAVQTGSPSRLVVLCADIPAAWLEA